MYLVLECNDTGNYFSGHTLDRVKLFLDLMNPLCFRCMAAALILMMAHCSVLAR